MSEDRPPSERPRPAAGQDKPPPVGFLREYVHFLLHHKAWWITPIILGLLLLAAYIMLMESAPVLPFVYTVR